MECGLSITESMIPGIGFAKAANNSKTPCTCKLSLLYLSHRLDKQLKGIEMNSIEILGTDDAVNTCDCCGKSNLKFTVAVSVNGEIMHYGSVCATKHTGKTSKQIKVDITDRHASMIRAAKDELRCRPEVAEAVLAKDVARKAGLVGVAFLRTCKEANDAERKVQQEIAEKYNLRFSEIYV
jgi:hypothetical protein